MQIIANFINKLVLPVGADEKIRFRSCFHQNKLLPSDRQLVHHEYFLHRCA